MKLIKCIFLFVLFSFSVLDAAWSTWTPPVQVSKHPSCEHPCVKMDAKGNAFAVWADKTHSHLLFSSLPFGATSWTSPKNVARINRSTDPQLFIDGNGELILFWKDVGDLGFVVLKGVHFSTHEGGWRPLPTLLLGLDKKNTLAQVAVNSEGKAIVIWVTEFFNEGMIQVSTLSPGKNYWECPHLLGIDVHFCKCEKFQSPKIALNDKGEALALWQTHFPSLRMQGARFKKGVWSRSKDLLFDHSSHFPSDDFLGWDMTYDKKGNGALVVNVFSKKRGREIILGTKLFSSKDHWSQLQLISNPETRGEFPVLAIDGSGNAVALFSETSKHSGINIFASECAHDKEHWTKAIKISRELYSIYDLKVVQDSFGNALALWTAAGCEGDKVESCLRSFKEPWGLPVQISTQDAHEGTVALSDVGAGCALWKDVKKHEVYASTFGNLCPSPPISISGSVKENLFINGNDRIHSITWMPSPTPGVVCYHLACDGKLVTKVDCRSTLKHDCHGCSTKKLCCYSVCAVNAQGMESLPATVDLK